LPDPLRAAGGVVVRDGQVLVVHRGRHDDWTFPKGKLEDGESWEQAALREVEEETGVRCELGPPLGSTRYPFREGTKEVRWFRMTPLGEPGDRDGEVDELRWLVPAAAAALLTYEHDRGLLARLEL
jgi:8-oxo-dGTP diphosphatase